MFFGAKCGKNADEVRMGIKGKILGVKPFASARLLPKYVVDALRL